MTCSLPSVQALCTGWGVYGLGFRLIGIVDA